ncbi:MAG: hypothetical protein ISR58_16660 [Anaerolineales bacterium]|nr:hypothetical protein [Chloroflexota bacterium]MBL6982806.1 hypothetical protein [Anaerolineales bacterium]
MKKIFPVLFILISILATACGSAAPAPLSAPTAIPTPVANVLYVDPDMELGEISPYLLGSNLGPWAAVPFNMLDAAYNSNVKAIRFPGGAWGDRNILKPYHIDPFIDFCKKIGAIPTISVNLRDGTPEQAAELVRYITIEKEYDVVYWAIGNEPTLFDKEIGADYDTAHFNTNWRKFAQAMKAVDSNIKLIGPDIHQYAVRADARPKDSKGLDWMDEFLKANGDMIDIATFHRYPFGTNPTKDDLRQNAKEWDDLVIALRGRIHELTGRDIPIALTEVNTNYNPAVGGDATPDSHFNAIWLADVVGQMAQQGVFMFNHWMLASSGGAQGGWGMIVRSGLRPSYYTYQMYSMFGSKLVYSASGVDNVSIYAAKREDGALTLMVVNLNDDAESVPLQFKGEMPSSAQLFLFDTEHQAQDMGNITFPNDGNLSVPGQSVSLYTIIPSQLLP